ncbi:MAG: Fic family protein [Flavipsychrobacter sp.]|jgi:Fic family protein|nr:Fic family protein [Flavipsychrobacter sp.]
MYIHQLKNWPSFDWDNEKLAQLLAEVRHKQGKLIGRMEAIGFKFREEAALQTLTLEIVKSNEIEGQFLNQEQVRSSIARRLGLDVAGLVPSDRNVEGVVELMLDATQHFDKTLSDERLFGWHAALFPTGRSGMHKIVVGNWRGIEVGPLQVVSGPIGREKVHYEAPEATLLENEMKQFLDWFNHEMNIDPVLKAAVAHLWFVTIHPFNDGNGRIARAIADMQLARADKSSQRFYSMSAQIEREKKDYYDMLENTQKGTLDITDWIGWFLNCLDRAVVSADLTLAAILKKAAFWERISNVPMNPRQHFMTNKLLDDFFGKLTSSKWAKMTKCSPDTALRDIQDLIEKGLMIKEEGGGRSSSYRLNDIK